MRSFWARARDKRGAYNGVYGDAPDHRMIILGLRLRQRTGGTWCSIASERAIQNTPVRVHHESSILPSHFHGGLSPSLLCSCRGVFQFYPPCRSAIVPSTSSNFSQSEGSLIFDASRVHMLVRFCQDQTLLDLLICSSVGFGLFAVCCLDYRVSGLFMRCYYPQSQACNSLGFSSLFLRLI